VAREIFRTGNSTVVSLPADALEAIGLALGDEVTVTVDPDRQRIIITPLALPGVRPGFLEQVDRFIDDYRPTLETLARE
jgi:antitoxin component of MazEF toxin-antitoxin module